MKRLKFSEPLQGRILNGNKTTTWRINDEKGIQKGDELSLCDMNCIEFAKAKVSDVAEKKFKDLIKKDNEGHEKFASDKEMYDTYSKYYNTKVTPEMMVKVIKFKLL